MINNSAPSMKINQLVLETKHFMPHISNPSTLPIFCSLTYQRFLFCSLQSKCISSSSSPVPSEQHIAHLILDQKSFSQALQTFKWASKLPNFTHSQSTYCALIHNLFTFCRFDIVKELLQEKPNAIGSPPDEDIFITIVLLQGGHVWLNG